MAVEISELSLHLKLFYYCPLVTFLTVFADILLNFHILYCTNEMDKKIAFKSIELHAAIKILVC